MTLFACGMEWLVGVVIEVLNVSVILGFPCALYSDLEDEKMNESKT